jgi:hypothetical protein
LLVLGTDASDIDTDHDGLIDSLEVHYYGTNPLHTDTDSDNLVEGLEALWLGTDPLVADTDRDGCSDGEEFGSHNPTTGGSRSPLDPFDFYDVPSPAGPTTGTDGRLILTAVSARNRAVSLQDIGVVLAYVGRVSTNEYYVADLDGEGTSDGLQIDRSPSAAPGEPWRSGAPNGAVSLQDVGVALAQVGHSCVAAPN